MDHHVAHEAAIDLLVADDAELAAIVARAGRPAVFRRPPTFQTLVLLILEQQVSLESAAAAFRRLAEHTTVTPATLLELDDSTLNRIGFSRQKTRYARALADAVIGGSLDVTALARAPDAEVRERLMALPGIGPWTADIFLLSCLGRPDVWPVGDRALRVAIAESLGLDTVPDERQAETIGIRWAPHRSTAAQLLWHDYLTRRGRVAPSA